MILNLKKKKILPPASISSFVLKGEKNVVLLQASSILFEIRFHLSINKL